MGPRWPSREHLPGQRGCRERGDERHQLKWVDARRVGVVGPHQVLDQHVGGVCSYCQGNEWPERPPFARRPRREQPQWGNQQQRHGIKADALVRHRLGEPVRNYVENERPQHAVDGQHRRHSDRERHQPSIHGRIVYTARVGGARQEELACYPTCDNTSGRVTCKWNRPRAVFSIRR